QQTCPASGYAQQFVRVCLSTVSLFRQGKIIPQRIIGLQPEKATFAGEGGQFVRYLFLTRVDVQEIANVLTSQRIVEQVEIRNRSQYARSECHKVKTQRAGHRLPGQPAGRSLRSSLDEAVFRRV